MKNAKTWRHIRAAVKRCIAKRFHSSYESPDPAFKEHALSILKLAQWANDAGVYDGAEPSPAAARRRKVRQEAYERLTAVVTGDPNERRVVHNCVPWACFNKNDAQCLKDVEQAIMNVLFDATPPIPALNRWTKLYPVVAWFACATLMHGLLDEAFMEATSKVCGARPEEDAVLDLAFVEDDVVVGLAADSDQLLFQRIQRLRFRKSAVFFSLSIDTLDVGCLVLSAPTGHCVDGICF